METRHHRQADSPRCSRGESSPSSSERERERALIRLHLALQLLDAPNLGDPAQAPAYELYKRDRNAYK
jgi:hypothetical protein